MRGKAVSFGDTVKVRTTDVTAAKGLAGLTGTVYGQTTPSITKVEVIGDLKTDYAVNVNFDANDEDAWFEPSLLEFIDHGAGQEITLDGIDATWVRSNSGEWVEKARRTKGKSWWQLWRS